MASEARKLDPEQWHVKVAVADEALAPPDTRPIPGLVGYRFGKDGRAWSGIRYGKWREMKASPGRHGVRNICVIHGGRKTTVTLAACVLRAWGEPRPLCGVPFHRDRDPANCKLDNLMWVPRGTVRVGSTRPNMRRRSDKLTHDLIARAKRMYEQGVTFMEIGESLGVHRDTITRALKGKSHKGAIEPLTSTRGLAYSKDDPRLTLEPQDIREARERHLKGESVTKIAKSLGVSWHALAWALKGKTHRGAIEPIVIEVRFPRGESHPRSKLTEAKVREIRAHFAAIGPKLSHRRLAKKYGVNKSTVRSILRGEIWAHVS